MERAYPACYRASLAGASTSHEVAPQIPAKSRRTCVWSQLPPRAVVMPIAFRPAAGARSVVLPAACSCLIVGARSAARDATRLSMASSARARISRSAAKSALSCITDPRRTPRHVEYRLTARPQQLSRPLKWDNAHDDARNRLRRHRALMCLSLEAQGVVVAFFGLTVLLLRFGWAHSPGSVGHLLSVQDQTCAYIDQDALRRRSPITGPISGPEIRKFSCWRVREVLNARCCSADRWGVEI
jgi:hypothetical protein